MRVRRCDIQIRMMDGWMTVYSSGRNGISKDSRHKEAWPLQRMNRSPVWVEFKQKELKNSS